jgi:cell division protein FtsI/penicillin-binding protein 2
MAIDSLTRRGLLRVLCGCSFASFAHCTSPRPDTLYAQSLQATLARHSDLELIVYDLRQSQTLASTFPTVPIPVGSLFKPFLALAYLNTPHPTVHTICHGHPDLCWTAHGTLTLPEALAQSCNAYFLAVARTLNPAEITLPAPPPNPTPEDLIGLTPRWLLTPETVVRAYAQLLTSPTPSAQILTGMASAALTGTASRIGQHAGGVLAKTGTAPCIPAPNQPCRVSGDGLVLAAVPAQSPTLLLLVRRQASTGALTAAAANPILTQLKALHAY